MYFGKLQVQWESDLQEFISEYSLMDLTKKSPKVEKQALATIGRLKGHLQKIEGLFTGFKNNLEQAFQLNQAHSAENLTNARSHDIWKTIGFSIASVGLFAVTWFGPPLAPLTAAGAVGAGTTAFGSGLAI